MSVIGTIIGWISGRKHSAYSPAYTAIVSALKRDGVRIGGTAGYPRVEVYGLTEGERLDKGGSLRRIDFTVESVSDTSINEASTLNEDNIARLVDEGLVTPDGWRCIGVVPGTLQDATEQSDSNKILYRLVQSFSLWIETLN